MRIAEIFRSFQGEGRLTGAESIFVRTSGCNLRCSFCDTPYASWQPEGGQMTVAEVLTRIEALANDASASAANRLYSVANSNRLAASPIAAIGLDWSVEDALPPVSDAAVSHVVVTGGEPMIVAELIPLCRELRSAGWHVTIETAGTRYLPVACDLMSVSPKLSNSTPNADRAGEWAGRHERTRHAPDVIRRLHAEYDCQFKFVVDKPEDCDDVLAYLAEFPEVDRDRVMLMPQGQRADELAARAQWLVPYCAAQGFTFCPRRHIDWFGCRRGT